MVDYSSSLLKHVNSSSCVFSQGYQREQVKTLKRFLIALFDAPVLRLFRLPPHWGWNFTFLRLHESFFKEHGFFLYWVVSLSNKRQPIPLSSPISTQD